ncbi:MAG: sulfur carrier protein ThiS [Planctomycetota bacterium]|nr:sulfur carrier protein ThiS [Planctomycetota bacterium]MDP6354820.1 sulfur carrier protein ThiS [Planctomycetota bacterium]MDP6653861.1 sulfur carrier protein ThiS [Gammaproteobacteria bacterium]MDP7249189.1 sulfur carrier protein ThiS [Planctomycetota bacterium]
MKIHVNGQIMELEGELTVTELFVRLEVDAAYRAVAINREVILKSNYDSTIVVDGDKVEIVRPVSGG